MEHPVLFHSSTEESPTMTVPMLATAPPGGVPQPQTTTLIKDGVTVYALPSHVRAINSYK